MGQICFWSNSLLQLFFHARSFTRLRARSFTQRVPRKEFRGLFTCRRTPCACRCESSEYFIDFVRGARGECVARGARGFSRKEFHDSSCSESGSLWTCIDGNRVLHLCPRTA